MNAHTIKCLLLQSSICNGRRFAILISCRRLVCRQIDETADALYTLYGLDLLRSSYRKFASIFALCGVESFQMDCLLGSNQYASDSVNAAVGARTFGREKKQRPCLTPFCLNRREHIAEVLKGPHTFFRILVKSAANLFCGSFYCEIKK